MIILREGKYENSVVDFETSTLMIKLSYFNVF